MNFLKLQHFVGMGFQWRDRNHTGFFKNVFSSFSKVLWVRTKWGNKWPQTFHFWINHSSGCWCHQLHHM